MCGSVGCEVKAKANVYCALTIGQALSRKLMCLASFKHYNSLKGHCQHAHYTAEKTEAK